MRLSEHRVLRERARGRRERAERALAAARPAAHAQVLEREVPRQVHALVRRRRCCAEGRLDGDGSEGGARACNARGELALHLALGRVRARSAVVWVDLCEHGVEEGVIEPAAQERVQRETRGSPSERFSLRVTYRKLCKAYEGFSAC